MDRNDLVVMNHSYDR